MNKEIRDKIIEELTGHFCYICHKRFSLFCGEPRVQIGGCCCGVTWGKTKYIRPVFAHMNCYMSKEVKRKETIMKFPKVKIFLVRYVKEELAHFRGLLKLQTDPIWKGIVTADIKEYQKWLEELDR